MNKEEINKIKSFLKEYQEIDFNVDLMQKSIISLGEKRDALLERVEDIKQEEHEFLQEMIKKYGESNITPNKILELINEEE